MANRIRAYAAEQKGAPLKQFEFDPGPLGDEQVEIAVTHCGVCHSDLSMIGNEWGMTQYPFVPGHEIIGTVAAAGSHARNVKVGQRVGLGWFAQSCMACRQCLAGHHNLCTDQAQSQQTIVGRHGGFADRVRCHWLWAMPLPAGLDPVKAGPLFCGGITVFGPMVECGVKPTDRVGVIGIGGLGHLALQFLNKWGCEVIAFTSSDSKKDEALKLGAHRVVNSRDPAQLKTIESSLNFVLSTVNAPLDWDSYIKTLAPNGRLHFVGAVLEPVPLSVFSLIAGAKSVSGSPLGSPATTLNMLDFCARHKVAPIIERFPMSKVNEALAHLHAGKARYRIVLENDFGK